MIEVLKSIVSPVLDKIIPDANVRAETKVRMLELYMKGEFGEEERRYDAIRMEAQSQDPWTSRARPAFLYVFYVLILSAVPFGILTVFFPSEAQQLQGGVSAWLNGLPQELWILFGAGYIGYVKKRSDDKETLLGAKTDKSWLQKIF